MKPWPEPHGGWSQSLCASDVSVAEGRGLTPCRRIAEARSWAILVNGEREYPTIECALLPGA